MPGSSHIFGLIPCSNIRKMKDKPRTVLMDGEIVISFDVDDNVQTIMALSGKVWSRIRESSFEHYSVALQKCKWSTTTQTNTLYSPNPFRIPAHASWTMQRLQLPFRLVYTCTFNGCLGL